MICPHNFYCWLSVQRSIPVLIATSCAPIELPLSRLPCRGSNILHRSIRATTLDDYPVVVAITCSYAYACFYYALLPPVHASCVVDGLDPVMRWYELLGACSPIRTTYLSNMRANMMSIYLSYTYMICMLGHECVSNVLAFVYGAVDYMHLMLAHAYGAVDYVYKQYIYSIRLVAYNRYACNVIYWSCAGCTIYATLQYLWYGVDAYGTQDHIWYGTDIYGTRDHIWYGTDVYCTRDHIWYGTDVYWCARDIYVCNASDML